MALLYTRPSEPLARELREVSKDALDLYEHLRGANYLPSPFPKAQLLNISLTLSELPNGTAEGCRVPLEHARNQLPAIRRQYILSEERTSLLSGEDSSPALVRYGILDDKIRYLIVSVTTALDEYRRAASRSEETDFEVEASVEPKRDESIEDAIQQSVELGDILAKAGETVAEIRIPDSDTADAFSRQLSDSQGLNRLANTELRMPQVVPGWFRKIVDALKQYPSLIRSTARSIRVGIDIFEIAMNQWNQLNLELEKLILSRFRKACDALTEVADKLEEYRNEKTAAVAVIAKELQQVREPIESSDYDPAEAVRMILMGKSPPKAWRPYIKSLCFSSLRLANLSPLSELTHLEALDIDNTLVSELSAISSLVSLRRLNLMNTNVEDVSPLQRLERLEIIDLDNSKVRDISPLASLRRLRSLNLGNTSVSNLKPISGLHELLSLDLNRTAITDLYGIGSLARLENLNISRTRVTDIQTLENLHSLTVLDLSYTSVVEIDSLASLRNLKDLNLEGTGVRDSSSLLGLINLERLNIVDTKIKNAIPLFELPNISKVNVRKT